MKSIKALIFIIIFFFISLIPLASMTFHKNPDSNENRVLQDMPQIMANGEFNKDFFSQMTNFFSDNFAYRVELVQLNELLYTSALKYSTNGKVIYGKDGWLYFNETINDYTGKTDMPQSKIERLVTVLSLESEYLDSLGIKYIFTVAPNKNMIYPEFMPGWFVKTTSNTVLGRLSDALKKSNVIYSDITAAIMKAKTEEGILYHKSDSHWNDLGARVGYNCLMKDIKSVFPDFVYNDLSSLKTVKTTAAGDLEKMLFPLNKESAEGYTSLNIEELYTAQTFFRSVEDANIVTTSDANKYRILMFRDSFGNAIIPFISNNFGYAHYSKEYPVNFRNLEEHTPDVVVLEIVQRNIPKLIEKAPVMPGIERQINLSGSINADGKIFIGTNGGLVHIFGYLDYNREKSYRCYVTDTHGKTFEAFPILESETAQNNFPYIKNAAGFSLYLKKHDLTGESFIVTVDFGDKKISHTFGVQEAIR